MTVTLYHGDCFDIFEQIPDNSIDFIAADVPYGILKHKIETKIDIPRYFKECYRVLKPNSFNLFFGRQPTLTTWNAEAFKLFDYKQEIIWYKRQRSSPMDDIGRVFENITVVMKGFRKFNQITIPYVDVVESFAEYRDKDSVLRAMMFLMEAISDNEKLNGVRHYLNGGDTICLTDKSKSNSPNSITSLINRTDYSRKIYGVIKGFLPQNIISFISHNKQRHDSTGNGGGEHNVKHPTVKPINMMEYLIQLCSNEGDTILDPFMGSGTTMLACLNTNRHGIGIELDADYFEIARDRVEAARSKAMLDTPIVLNTPAPMPAKPKVQQTLF